MAVSISGAGVAASCCAYLLNKSGQNVLIKPATRRSAPSVLMSDSAVSLLRDVFDKPDLFCSAKRITRRIVVWGGEEPVALPHASIAVTGDEIDKALHVGAEDKQVTADFSIYTSPPFPAGEVRRFGARKTAAAAVTLLNEADNTACWIEAVEDGWLFLSPSTDGKGWLLATGHSPEDLLSQSRYIAPRIRSEGARSISFETAPGLHAPLLGNDWLVCGGAALTFDPICGDGTAQAVREAILASAVCTGIIEDGDRQSLLTHYESMLLASMRRHLRISASFYDTGGQSEWWRSQLSALAEGFDWCSQHLSDKPQPQYVLDGFRLVPRELSQ